MWEYNYTQTNELCHYGVPGMRWGKRKASYYEIKKNPNLERKAAKLDKKAAKYKYKAEKIHEDKDLKEVNKYSKKVYKAQKKAAKLEKKVAIIDKKAAKNSDTSMATKYQKAKYQSKVEAQKNKAAKYKRKADLISKTAGYGSESMKQLIKAENVAAKAQKTRKRIAKNERYIALMNKRLSETKKK